ncbi:T9SS type A sorting domain-containing protein [Rufibacter latericius]|uniref:T9SS type A sorting domain-containing protein n=1 Tax=Rufibacter latericius TaxID=2487040 RepID=UPI0014023AB9|nr:T9SS type A sorting domain-containing protein [Rufibacter latericius]
MLFLISFSVQATHLRGGELYYKSDTTAARNPLKFFITLVTYSVAPPPFEDLEATLYFGDCTSQTVARESRTLLGDSPLGTFVNTYQFEHTFAGPGTYKITYAGSSRNAGTVNISNSVQQRFFLQSTLVADPLLGINRSPVLRTLPVDIALRNQFFTHNPSAFDADGDSLSYKLVTPLTSNGENACGTPLGQEIPSHRGLENFLGVPDARSPAGFTLDRKTGQLTWNTPGVLGEYIVAMVVEEWRGGRLIGQVMRDRQLLVRETPIVTGVSEEWQEQISTFPNPASSTLTLKVPAHLQLRETQVYNSVGTAFTLPVWVKTKDEWVFNVEGLPEGLYLLHLRTAQGKMTKKLMVKR